MEITAALVKELRDRSGVGMMECKKALVETGGNIDKAFDYLRKAGAAKALKKEGREAKEGVVLSYIHPGAKLGVLLELNCETDFVAKTDDFVNLGNDIAMHIAATDPLAVSSDNISNEIIEKEKEIYTEQAKKTNKPAEIIEKMVEGRLKKFFKENVLMEQDFVKDPNKTIKDIITDTVGKLGENIVITRFKRFQLGENS
ncbi:MAG: translation elongation factor Ts [Candidatus Marinimicrobia bacterium]|nr:translation elongation factor Ts [Candidatus Neomarinimicrobiota bacterium]|tara:strand:+ start:20626 stop:21225 length:600 start_codon:yes stop_codon:yes gene_type:complete